MYYVKRAIYGPDPKEQKRKCDALIRKNQRELDKQLAWLRGSENKTTTLVKQCVKRNDMKSAKLLAQEIYKAQRHREKLLKSKAQLGSIQLQVGEAFAMQKLQGSMNASAQLMKEVNQLVHVPEIMSTMAMLGQELVKSGIIDDMVTDTLDSTNEVDVENEVDGQQVDAILNEIVSPKKDQKVSPARAAPASQEPETADEDEETINTMRERLRALQG